MKLTQDSLQQHNIAQLGLNKLQNQYNMNLGWVDIQTVLTQIDNLWAIVGAGCTYLKWDLSEDGNYKLIHIILKWVK